MKTFSVKSSFNTEMLNIISLIFPHIILSMISVLWCVNVIIIIISWSSTRAVRVLLWHLHCRYMWRSGRRCQSSCCRWRRVCPGPRSHSLCQTQEKHHKYGCFNTDKAQLKSQDSVNSPLHTGQHESGGVNCSFWGQVSGRHIWCKQVHVRS